MPECAEVPQGWECAGKWKVLEMSKIQDFRGQQATGCIIISVLHFFPAPVLHLFLLHFLLGLGLLLSRSGMVWSSTLEPHVNNTMQTTTYNFMSNCTQTTPLNLDTLCSSLGNTHYLDHGSTGSTGYNSGVSLCSTLMGSDFYINNHNLTFQQQHKPSPLLPHLWSPFGQHTDTTSHHIDSYLHNMPGLGLLCSHVCYTYSTYNIELAHDYNQNFLCQALDVSLIATQNPAYMHLFMENIWLWSSLETLEYNSPFKSND